MEFDAKDHWETLFDHSYSRWFNLQGQPALVEITKVEKGVEMTLRGGAKTKKPVVHFKQIKGHIEEVKPLVLNVTNGNSLAQILGPKPSGWIGKQVVLYPDVTKMYDKESKQMVEVGCIRVREPKPKTQEVKS